MKSNLFYYSVNSFLSFKINEKYYKDLHYVWVSPSFNGTGNPASSNPCEIYHSIYKSIGTKDNHCDYIERNRTGILNGAEEKLKSGIITPTQRDQIAGIISSAEKIDFRPLLYVIHASKVSKMIIDPTPSEKANPFSNEYKILALPRKFFDILEFDL